MCTVPGLYLVRWCILYTGAGVPNPEILLHEYGFIKYITCEDLSKKFIHMSTIEISLNVLNIASHEMTRFFSRNFSRFS